MARSSVHAKSTSASDLSGWGDCCRTKCVLQLVCRFIQIQILDLAAPSAECHSDIEPHMFYSLQRLESADLPRPSCQETTPAVLVRMYSTATSKTTRKPSKIGPAKISAKSINFGKSIIGSLRPPETQLLTQTR